LTTAIVGCLAHADHSIFYHPTSTGYAFIGDPTPFGYSGERHIFYGHHPVALDGRFRPLVSVDVHE